ncbi:hypothetical protein PBY51_014675 [Eleginops maclovinus]|uniref:PDZ domain-containing protein n=1 Tax=Eleginops maclovinus TaxID=56733 RepID=A0AAN7X3E0_ELEMC|nr:hypothetical protein PBY51_014675 [Eleginops maclovinus]
MMSEDSSSRRFSESLILDNSKQGVVITGITDDRAAKSGLRAGDEIVAATIHLDHLNKDEVLNVLKALEPYDDNMKVLTKKQLNASAGLGSLGLDLDDPSKMLSLKEDLSLDASSKAPAASVNELMGKLNGSNGLGGEIGGATINGGLPGLSLNEPSADAGAKFRMPSFGMSGPDVNGELDGTLKASDVSVSAPKLNTPSASLDIGKPGIKTGNQKYKPPKFTMPHFNLPQLKTPKAKMDVSGDVNLPSANVETPDLNLSAPRLDLNSPGNLSTPDLDVDTSLKTGIDLSGPQTTIGVPDVNLSTPDVKAPQVNLNLPRTDVKGPSMALPKADFSVPDLNLNAPDISLSSPNIDGKLSAPNIDTGLPNVDLNLPKADIKVPDAQLKTPGIGFDSHVGEFNMPHFNLPNVGLSSPKVRGIQPSVEAGIEAPKVNIDTPVVDIKGPEAPNVDANLEKLKLSELFNFSGSKIKSADVNTSADFEISPDVNVKAPTVKGGIDLPNANVSGPEVKTGFNTPELDATAEVKESPKSKLRWPFKWGLKSGSNTDEEETDSESDVLNAEMEMPVFKTHRLPRSSIDGIGGIGDTLNLSKLDTEAKDYVVSKGIRLPIVNATSKAGGKVDIMERLRMANKRTSPASISPTDAKSDIDLNLAAPSLDVSASTEADSSLMRGGTFKVEKPESVLGLVAPEISTSDENDKLSLSLSNMLCLNKQSESE